MIMLLPYTESQSQMGNTLIELGSDTERMSQLFVGQPEQQTFISERLRTVGEQLTSNASEFENIGLSLNQKITLPEYTSEQEGTVDIQSMDDLTNHVFDTLLRVSGNNDRMSKAFHTQGYDQRLKGHDLGKMNQMLELAANSNDLLDTLQADVVQSTYEIERDNKSVESELDRLSNTQTIEK